jgi:hypothetical protein
MEGRQSYGVRVREELSCFRLAQEIQKVECMNCGRMFSKEASLRHIPVCQKLRLQEMYDSMLRRHRPSSKAGGESPRDRQMKARSVLYCKQLRAGERVPEANLVMMPENG